MTRPSSDMAAVEAALADVEAAKAEAAERLFAAQQRFAEAIQEAMSNGTRSTKLARITLRLQGRAPRVADLQREGARLRVLAHRARAVTRR